MPKPWTTWVALLRAVNVGGHKKLKMAELRSVCESLALRQVSTYLQSGNVVFQAQTTSAPALARTLESGIEQHFGFTVDLFLRTAAELNAVVDKSPFAGRQPPQQNWLTVMFLEAPPAGVELQRFIDTYAGPEQLIPQGRELFIYYTNGIGRSKLPQAMAPLKLHGTGRNWNTILKLRDALAAI